MAKSILNLTLMLIILTTALYNVEAEIAGMALADKWTFAGTLTLQGDLSGSVDIDGSTDVVLNAQIDNRPLNRYAL